MANYSNNKRKSTDGRTSEGKCNTRIRNGNRSNKCDTRTKVAKTNSSLENDPEWYNTYPELVDSNCRISSAYPIGINYTLGSGEDAVTLVNDTFAMRLRYIHGIGISEKETDPVNMAATRIYSYVRHANSGHANYEKTDLMLYFLSIMECYNMIAYAERAYGLVFMYNTQNRKLPVSLVKAAGWDYDDITENLTNFRSYINNAIARINSLYVPTELKAAKRWWWLNSNVFLDSANPKAYCYLYTPDIYRTYEELEAGNLGYLKTNQIPLNFTVTQWKIAINTMLNKLLASEDIGIISGDILKAYGDKVFTLSPMEEFHSVPFVYSEEVLMQINNTRFVSAQVTGTDITQQVSLKGSNLVMKPGIKFQNETEMFNYINSNSEDWIINFTKPQPTPSDVMVATRNMWTFDGYDADTFTATLSTGSEIMVYEQIYYANEAGLFNPSKVDANDAKMLEHVLRHAQFDYAPLIVRDDTKDGKRILLPSGPDYDTIVPINGVQMNIMHDTALLSLFTAMV